jgi:hypothetical protein
MSTVKNADMDKTSINKIKCQLEKNLRETNVEDGQERTKRKKMLNLYI